MMTTHQQVHTAYALVMLNGRGIGRETVLSTVYRARGWEMGTQLGSMLWLDPVIADLNAKFTSEQ